MQLAYCARLRAGTQASYGALGLPAPPSSWDARKTCSCDTCNHQGDAQTATNEFRKAIETLPADMQVSIVDAFETDTSAIVLLRMTYAAWATLLATVDFGWLAPSLADHPPHEPTLRVLETGNLTDENRPPVDITQVACCYFLCSFVNCFLLLLSLTLACNVYLGYCFFIILF